jgi:hypothetical protein
MLESAPANDDWGTATFEGSRRRQHQEFHALSLREKVERIEHMEEVIARLGGSAVSSSPRSVCDRNPTDLRTPSR